MRTVVLLRWQLPTKWLNWIVEEDEWGWFWRPWVATTWASRRARYGCHPMVFCANIAWRREEVCSVCCVVLELVVTQINKKENNSTRFLTEWAVRWPNNWCAGFLLFVAKRSRRRLLVCCRSSLAADICEVKRIEIECFVASLYLNGFDWRD